MTAENICWLEKNEGIERRGYKPQDPLYKIDRSFSQTGEARVCSIDDNLGLSRQIAEYFSDRGFAAFAVIISGRSTAANLIEQRQLVEAILQESPDVVISDIGLGPVNGLDLIRAIRAAGCPTIIFTGASATKATEQVADLYFDKLVRFDMLINGVRSLLFSPPSSA